MTGPTSRQNWLTFDGDPVPDTDSESFFTSLTIAEQKILGHLLAFVSDSDKRMNLQHFGSDPDPD